MDFLSHIKGIKVNSSSTSEIPSDDHKSQASDHLNVAVPAFVILPTRADNLECGLFAIFNSLAEQLTEHAPHSADQLQSILSGAAVATGNPTWSTLSLTNLTINQVAAVVELWGEQCGIDLQLGVIIDGNEPSTLVLPSSDGAITIWIHNDNAAELLGSTYIHYSGVRIIDPAESVSEPCSEPVSVPAAKANVAQQAMDLLALAAGTKGFSVPALDSVDEEEAATLSTMYDEPLSNEYQKAAGFKSSVETSGNPSNTEPLTAKVAWTTSQNKLVDDAARRVADKFLEKVIIRVLP
ncbi:hypothetical protein F52700_3172 [Fusarium sp. NRRL 52700]|nr:hypothetical protein F52700_3172 [Fusarium sp. NRRL 52700]